MGQGGWELQWCGPEGRRVVLEAPGHSNVHITTARELQTCTFERHGLQKHHQNSTKRHPQREEKNKSCGGRGKKKSEILGGPAVQGKGGPGKCGPNPTLKPTPTHETPLHETVTHNTQHTTHNKSKSVLAKVGFGQSRFRPKSAMTALISSAAPGSEATLTRCGSR